MDVSRRQFEGQYGGLVAVDVKVIIVSVCVSVMITVCMKYLFV